MNNQENFSADIVGRIKYLMHELRLNQLRFAERIEIDPSNLSKHLNGHLAINDTLINKIAVNLGVSREWLRTGKDLPFSKNRPPEAVKLQRIVLSQVKHGTPVYDIDVTAGMMSRSTLFADDNIIGTINIPTVSKDCKILKVSGDSMYPVISNGDMLAVREVGNTDIIFWGQIYVAVLEDYRMVKYIRRHKNPNKVILRSANPEYDDIEIFRFDIRELFLVQNIIHIDTRL